MKRNPDDKYAIEIGNENWIEDRKTNEQMLFYIDKDNKIVVRSMLEEDIKPFMNLLKISSREKREKMKILYNEIPKEKSQEIYFVIEKIVGEEKTGKWDEIYGLPRTPMGLAARIIQPERSYIYANLFAKFKDYKEELFSAANTVADIFNEKQKIA